MSDPRAPVTPTPQATFTLTGNHNIDMLLAGVLFSASTWLANWGVEHLHLAHIDVTTLAIMIFGVLAGVATAAWVWITSRLTQARDINAGVNLFASGSSVNIPVDHTGLVTPKLVTPMSAQDIVRNFGNVQVTIPNETALTDALNETQVVDAGKAP